MWSSAATCALAFVSCSAAVCQEVAGDARAARAPPPPGGGVSGVAWAVAADDAQRQCELAINDFKMCAAVSMPVMYLYTLYYLRGFDSFNFYTHMIFIILNSPRSKRGCVVDR